MAASSDDASSGSHIVSIERTRRRQRRRLLPAQQASQELSTAVGPNPGPRPSTMGTETGAQESQLTLPGGGKSASSTVRRSNRSPQPMISTESRKQKVTATAASGSASMVQAPPRLKRIAPPSVDPTGGAGTFILPMQTGGPSSGPSHPDFRRLRLGIETEFYLAAYNTDLVRADFNGFTHALATLYNIEAAPEHPRMHSYGGMPYMPEDYTEWVIDFEDTNRRPNSPWGLEMQSPILDVFPGSPWRAHVRAAWRYLKRYYQVTGDEKCGTHIHLSLVPHYSLAELKQIAASIVYFEPAFLALVPEHRRRSTFAVSNWLVSPRLCQRGRSRRQSMEDIWHAGDVVDLFILIQGQAHNNFMWNFMPLFTSKKTIEFRLPPASITLEETLGWAELALNFIQAATQHGYLTPRFEANVGGLRSFLAQVNVPGVNEPAWLRTIWKNKQGHEAVEPVPALGFKQGMFKEETPEQIRELLENYPLWT